MKSIKLFSLVLLLTTVSTTFPMFCGMFSRIAPYQYRSLFKSSLVMATFTKANRIVPADDSVCESINSCDQGLFDSYQGAFWSMLKNARARCNETVGKPTRVEVAPVVTSLIAKNVEIIAQPIGQPCHKERIEDQVVRRIRAKLGLPPV